MCGNVPDDKPWIEQYPSYWPETIEYPEITVPELLDRRCTEFADETAIVFQDRTYTYAELGREVERVAAGLAAAGVEQGERVSICLPNSPIYTFSFYGVLSLGAVTVHTSYMYTKTELERQLRDAGATTAIVLDVFADRLEAVVDDTPVERVIVASLSSSVPSMLDEFIGSTNEWTVERDGWQWFDDVRRAGEDESPPVPELDVDDLASLPYTGGTTGFPKGVKISHRNWVSEAAVGELVDLVAYSTDQNVQRGDQLVTGLMPMFHVNGNWSANLFALYNGSGVVLYPRFDPETVLADIENRGITHMHAVPTMLSGLLNHPDAQSTDFSSLRHVLVASAPVPAETKAEFEELTEATTFEGFGQTEVAMTATVEPPTNRRDGSCGIPVPGTHVDIFELTKNEPLAAGEIGELVVKSDTIMQGYWENDAATEECLDDGWLRTGDLGYRDDDWFFYHVDRRDDMIVTSGHNVYPAEVESVLYEHEAVLEAAVIGLPDEYRGSKVTAFIELVESDRAADRIENELHELCQEHLSNYKRPRQFVFRTLPRTDVGKISRTDLKQEVLSDDS